LFKDDSGRIVNPSGNLIDPNTGDVIDDKGNLVFPKHMLDDEGQIPLVFRNKQLKTRSGSNTSADFPTSQPSKPGQE